MFNEDEDWNDEQEAQILSQNVLKKTQKTKSNTNVKVVGKKSLLRTLQTLGSVPEWESNNRLQDSDSETETAPLHSKKKRRKKRKHKEKHEDGQENGDINHAVPEEKPLPKKRKKAKETGSINSNKITAGEKKEKEISDSAQVNTNKPQDTERVSRKLWKNKMKNKRKCKNKYRQDKLEDNVNKTETADKQEQKKEVKIDSQSNKHISQNICQTTVQKRKEKEHKPLKKNNADRGTPTIEEQQHKEKKRLKRETEKSSSDSSGVGSKPIPDDHQGKITDDQQESAMQKRKPELNKDRSLKRQKLRKIILSQETDQHASPADQKDGPVLPEEEVKQSGSDSFRARMEQRLESARFRYINEVLYSTTSGEAKRMFQQDPQAFRIYHKGYTAQVQRWPTNPVDEIIAYIQKKSSSLVVADFGCGDCKIARSVKNKVHSFDLVATSNLVTVCDMANVPLGDSSVDIAVFCLSLMGTNLADFLAEANRVLKIGGVLKIAEVASRFDNVRNFISALASLGFKLVSKGTENTHFHSFEFRKTGNAPKNVKKYGLQLKPCVYKKR